MNEPISNSSVVSASHLAQGNFPSLSEMEFALTMTNNGFQRWIVRCMAAAGVPGLNALEVLILHLVRHREREKTQADICLVLDIEDTHTVAYAVKKLEGMGLVTTGRRGKEKTVRSTQEGDKACDKYKEVRETLLVNTILEAGLNAEDVSRLAGLLRVLSGHYDQAARSAAAA